MDPRGLAGILQGNDGKLQGSAGSLAGRFGGPAEGMARAASGGMEGQTPVDKQRKSMGFMDFLKPLVGSIPGIGTALNLGMQAFGALQGMNAQKQAGRAAGAAQGAEGNALGGMTGLAGRLAGQPDYSGILNAEKSGVNTFMRDQGGVANPGAVAKDMMGNAEKNAIGGALGQRRADLGAAGGLLGNTVDPYNRMGTQAAGAASAGGNPFSSFMNALQGEGGGAAGGVSSAIGKMFNPGGQTGMDTSPSTGGIDIGPSGGGFGQLPPLNMGNQDFGSAALPALSAGKGSVTMGNKRKQATGY